MAFIDFPVLSGNLNGKAGDTVSQGLTPKDSQGAGIDMTSGAVTCKAWLASDPFGSASSNSLTPTIALVSASAGKAVLAITLPEAVGRYNYEVGFTPSGGSAQQIVQGSMVCN